MGFFSDFKSDLSQAVNELVPEDQANQGEQEATEEVLQDADVKVDEDINLDDLIESDEVPADEVSEPITKEEKKAKDNFVMKSVSDETAVITSGMVINGDITSSGSLELLGTVNGNIALSGKLNIVGKIIGDSKAAEIYAENANITGEINSSGSVKIGQSSVIIGNIFASSAVVAGAVKGDIDVKGPVVLDASAIVMGNIKSKSVQINNGAVIEGMCSQCYADVSPTSFFDDIKKTKNK